MTAATCPGCGTRFENLIPVVQRAELLRNDGILLVSYESTEIRHACPDPSRDRHLSAVETTLPDPTRYGDRR